MKVYRFECENYTVVAGGKLEDECKGEWNKLTITSINMNMIARYLVDSKENPGKYRNVKLYVGELEEVKDIDINTIEKLYL